MKYLFLVLLFSCSTPSLRIKETPRFNLLEKEAKTEYEKFKLGYIGSRGGNFQSEGRRAVFKIKEFSPILSSVAPELKSSIFRSKIMDFVGWTILGLTAGSLFLMSDSKKRASFHLAGLGTSLIFSFAHLGYNKHIKNQFNQKLKSKIYPKLSYSFKF